MNYLERLFESDIVRSLGGCYKINLFGKELDVPEIIPHGSELYYELLSRWKIYQHSSRLERFDELKILRENRQRFSELSSLYNRNEVIPFIGAGLSIPSGLPGWESLLNDLSLQIVGPRNIEAARKLIASNNFEVAADEIYRRLRRNSFNERLENRYRVLNYNDIKGEIKMIPSLFPDFIITTNFDNIIETIIKEEYPERTLQIVNGTDLVKLETAKHDCIRLIKLHGDYRIPRSRILLKDEYDRAYSDQRFKDSIKYIAENYTILFLGCSLVRDRYLDTIKMLRRRQSYNRRNYTIIKSRFKHGDREFHRQIDSEEGRLNAMNIYPIWVEEYSDIEVILFGLLGFYAQEVELNVI